MKYKCLMHFCGRCMHTYMWLCRRGVSHCFVLGKKFSVSGRCWSGQWQKGISTHTQIKKCPRLEDCNGCFKWLWKKTQEGSRSLRWQCVVIYPQASSAGTNVFLGSCEDMKKAPLNRTFWFIYIVCYMLMHHVVGLLCRSTCLWYESSLNEYKNGEREGGREICIGYEKLLYWS